MLHLTFPNISHKQAYSEMLTEWKQSGELDHGRVSPGVLFCGDSYEEFLQIVQNDLTMNHRGVPATLFFLLNEGRILGGIQIRHSIDHPILRESGGHIGYSIRPSERKKGYATEILRLGLIEAKQIGLTEVLIGCNDDNIGSIKTILNNGGIFERYTDHDGHISRRYWINIR